MPGVEKFRRDQRGESGKCHLVLRNPQETTLEKQKNEM